MKFVDGPNLYDILCILFAKAHTQFLTKQNGTGKSVCRMTCRNFNVI